MSRAGGHQLTQPPAPLDLRSTEEASRATIKGLLATSRIMSLPKSDDPDRALDPRSASPYRMPRAVPAPNLGRVFSPPPPGSRLWWLLDLFSNSNVWLYRLSGGRIGGRMGRAPVLLLHHVGRRSGEKRVTPVLFLADGARLIVVASKGGAARHPGWFHNLKASPMTTVEVGRDQLSVRAREADEDERAAYWPQLEQIYPSYAVYQRRTDRRLPVIVLEPANA